MSIAPVTASIDVGLPPAKAFDLFTNHIGEWWGREKTIAPRPPVDVTIEPRVGGRWFERDAEGEETDWGDVLAWEPPHRLLLAWRIGADWKYDPAFETEVEILFEAVADGTCVRLEHRNLERFGASVEKIAAGLNGGWPTQLHLFSQLAAKEDVQ